jgi:hypothetical protein
VSIEARKPGLQTGGAAHDANQDSVMATLPPMANMIVDRAIENMTRKLIAGYRNKRNAKPNAKKTDFSAEAKEVLRASSAQSVMEVANRGQAWREMVQKSFTHGISSLKTIKYDGEFNIKNGKRPEDFKHKMPHKPGVYVVYDNNDKPVYVGDSKNMQSRWNAGHFNEYNHRKKESGKPYKLADSMEKSCTVRFIIMESEETAAALEAHLIKENYGNLINSKQELAAEQGTRKNQEAKKIKDSSGTTTGIALGAAQGALMHAGYDVLEQLTTVATKAVKNELVDLLGGGSATIKVRIKRILTEILAVIRNLIEAPLKLLRGIAEFIINALSKTIGQIYNLVRNIFDLTTNTWNLYKEAPTMPREELVRKISETVIVSGSLVVWDSLDLILEKWLVAQTGGALAPFAPYISAAVTAVGFGISTHALQGFVSRIIDAVIAFKLGFIETLHAERAACEQLIILAENELAMIGDLREYVGSESKLLTQVQTYIKDLSNHEPIQPIDPTFLLITRS